MDFGRAFSFPFADPDWVKKIIITALISLIPIVGWLYLFGWMVEILRRVLQKDPTPMPDDIDFGKFAMDGLKAFVVYFVYSIPLIIFYLPVVLVPIIASGGSSNDGSNAAAGIITAVTVCCCGVAVLYGLLMTFILPAAIGNFVASERLGAAFQFGEVFGLVRAAPGAYLMVFLGALVVGVISSLGSVVVFVGVLLTTTYGQAVMGHLYAQAYQEAKGNRSLSPAYPA